MPDRRHRARARLAGAAVIALVTCTAAIRQAQAEIPRSKDDRGFSILLVSPTDPFLTGRQDLRIEAIIPRGDSIEEVDFFVDGRLVLVAQGEPFEAHQDFGADIRRHVIEVRALTHQGRRAKVSFVSRSVDVSEGAAAQVTTIAAVVRNTAGRPVSLLGVSDFVLTEDTQRRSIVHFAAGPSPAAIAFVLDAHARASAPADILTPFLRDLPDHQVVALVGGPPEADKAWESPGALCEALQQAPGAAAPAPGTPAPGAEFESAATLLAARREPRVLLLIVTLEPAPPPEAAPEPAVVERTPPPEAKMKPPHTATPLPIAEPPPSPDDLLAAGLESVLRTRAAIYVIGVGPSDARVPQPLRDVAARSGGQFLLAADLAVVPQALRSVSEALRNRYLITFLPAEPGRAGWHAIELAVHQPDLAVQAPKTLSFP